jgi:hypothetical protein
MAYGIEPGTGSALLMGWLARPYDPERAIAALLGLSPRVTRQLLGAVLATSDEAEGLLATMPTVVRSLTIATTDRPQRTVGEIRGPILWSETMAARAASAGNPELFVCATTTRAYDTDENRVLVAALDLVRRSGHEAEQGLDDATAEDVVRRARHNAQVAARFLDHQALTQVPAARPTARALRRTRAGARRATYRPALTMLRRGAEPLGPALVQAFADEQTRSDHDLLAAILQRVETVTGDPVVLRSDAGELVAGRVRYRHPARSAGDHPAGITVGSVQVARPARTGAPEVAAGHALVVVSRAEDVALAVERGLG